MSNKSHNAPYRYALYYLRQLRNWNEAHKLGGENVLDARIGIEQDWGQIKNGQTWAAENAHCNEDALALCSEYPYAGAELLDLFQPVQERLGWLETALEAAKQCHCEEYESVYLNLIGLWHADQGNYQNAIPYYRAAIQAAQKSKLAHLEGQARNCLGVAHMYLGHYSDAVREYKQALALARQARKPRDEGTALNNMGEVYLCQGEQDAAAVYYEQALLIAQDIKNLRGEANALGNLGNIYYNKGYHYRSNLHQAVQYYQASLKIYQKIADDRGEATARCMLGDTYRLLHHDDEAVTQLEKALSIGAKLSDQYLQGNVCYQFALFYKDRNQPPKALLYARKALEHFEDIKADQLMEQTKQLIRDVERIS